MKTIFLSLILILVYYNTSYSQDLKDHLLIYYPLDGDALDYSGNDFHGNGNAEPTTDRFRGDSRAMEFNGINSFIDLPNDPRLEPQFPFSIAFWVYCTGEAKAILSTDFAQNNHTGAWFGRGTDKTFNFAIGNAEGNTSPNQRVTLIADYVGEDDTWYHIAAVRYNAIDADFYINAVKRDFSGTGTATYMGYTSSPGSLGRKDANVIDPPSYFTGKLDEFYFWDRAITQEEVDTLFYSRNSIIEQNTYLSTARIFPNPSDGFFRLLLPDGNSLESIGLYDLNGKEIWKIEGPDPEKNQYSTQGLANGMYFVRFEYTTPNGDKFFRTEKLVMLIE